MDRDYIERRKNPYLDEDTIELLASRLTERLMEPLSERAAEKAIVKMENNIYQSMGKWGIKGFIKIVGVVVLGAYLLLSAKGYIKLGN